MTTSSPAISRRGFGLRAMRLGVGVVGVAAVADMVAPGAAVAATTGPEYDPRAYGAVFDGLTDDSGAIQKAIDACAFRYRDERNFWLASTAGLVKTVAGIATVAEQGLGQIPDGSILEVICTGPSISVLVNSVPVACVTDHDLAEDTRFGLASLAYSPSASTDYFSSFQVS